MKIDNVIYRGNKSVGYVIFVAYVIILVFLLPQKFSVEEIINTSTEKNEVEEPKNYYIKEVPLINQFPELPTGCEVASAAMLLNFYGINVSKETLAEQVSKAELPKVNKGRVEGKSPNDYFIGNPRDSKAFGAFNKPMFELINNYKAAENITGCEFSQVIEQVKAGQPVMVWITRELAEVEYTTSWYVVDEVFWWPKGEHTVVVTGVEENAVIVNDPYGGEEKRYSLEKFKRIWEAMGSQAIVVNQ